MCYRVTGAPCCVQTAPQPKGPDSITEKRCRGLSFKEALQRRSCQGGVHGVNLAASFLNPEVLREMECKRKHKGVNLCVWPYLVDLFKIIYQL